MEKYIELFRKLGFILNSGQEQWNTLVVNQRTFQSRLLDHARKNADALKQFLGDYMEANEMNFLVALLPTKFSPQQPNPANRVSNQDNLLRILVELKPLQTFILDMLVEKTFAYTESLDTATTSERIVLGANMNDVAVYCINQFKYIPRIYAPKELCDRLLELITSLSNVRMRCEIVQCLPDIIGDWCHGEHAQNVVEQLSQFLSDVDLVAVTLDTVLDLSLSQFNVERIVDKLFCNYGLVHEKDIAAVVNFILKSASDLKSISMFERLRNKLRLEKIRDEKNRFRILEVFREYFCISVKSVELFFSLMERILADIKEKNETWSVFFP